MGLYFENTLCPARLLSLHNTVNMWLSLWMAEPSHSNLFIGDL